MRWTKHLEAVPMSLIQDPFDCVPCTSLFTSTEPTSDKWQGVEKEEKEEREEIRWRSWVSRGERFVEVCCVNLDIEWDAPALAPALIWERPGQAPPTVARIQVLASTSPDSSPGRRTRRGGNSSQRTPYPLHWFSERAYFTASPCPVCWNLSLRNHCRPHHLVYLVVQRQQRFCTIFILPKVVKMQAGRGGSRWRKHTPLLEQYCFEKLLPSGVESVSWPSGIKRCRDSSRNASSPWPWYLFAKPYRKSVLCVPWKTKQNAGIRKNNRLVQTALHQQTLKKIRCWKSSSLWHVIFQHALKTHYMPSLVSGADRVCGLRRSCSSGRGKSCWNKGGEWVIWTSPLGRNSWCFPAQRDWGDYSVWENS